MRILELSEWMGKFYKEGINEEEMERKYDLYLKSMFTNESNEYIKSFISQGPLCEGEKITLSELDGEYKIIDITNNIRDGVKNNLWSKIKYSLLPFMRRKDLKKGKNLESKSNSEITIKKINN